jgi:hypothetical protein
MKAQSLTAEVTSRAPRDRTAGDGAFAFVFESPRGLAVITVLFAVTGLALVFGHAVVYDEGLLTYVFARWLVLDPLPVLFFQKVKPVTALLFAIPSLGGADVTLAVHVAVAALAAPMLAAVARALGIRLPNLPALIVLVSPLFLVGAASGVSNVDGVVGTSLFLYLAVAKRRNWLAGFVLGCLPWVRYELAPLAIMLWLYMALVERNRGIALGGTIFPVVYAISGAAYHWDPLWFVHFAPTTAFPMPGNAVWDTQKIGLRYLLGLQLLVTPTIGFALLASPARLSPIERALFVCAGVSLALLAFLPLLRLGNFGMVARYFLQPLPILALLAARAVEPYLQGGGPAWKPYARAAGLAVLWAVSDGPHATLAMPILGAYLAVAVCASLGWGAGAVWAVALAACVGLALPRNEMKTPVYFEPALAWLNAHAPEIRRTTIYTNSPVIPFGIASSPKLAESDVRFIVAPDILWEIDQLSNPANGQRAALRRVAARELFGTSVPWDELSPDAVPADSLFVLDADPRLPATMPSAVWAGRLEQIGGGDFFTINRLVPPGSATAASARAHAGAL